VSNILLKVIIQNHIRTGARKRCCVELPQHKQCSVYRQ